MELFADPENNTAVESRPLAERMRPRSLQEFVGQSDVAGPGSLLAEAIRNDRIFSMILWGPPGTGKTTLARIVAHTTRSHFVHFSAVLSGVKEIRAVIEEAREMLSRQGKRTILFVDEIHRFNKAQQDAFLPHVEQGNIILIGATTENPSFEVISPLLSRCQVYVLKSLGKEDLIRILHRAIETDYYLKQFDIRLTETNALLRLSGGDARKLMNMLELVITTLAAGNAETL
ncbi:MAG: AAA family ATPase, partial [Desulfatitalea sp.]|nr:AAA family ATPase [Desulfatitalea sp.]